MPLTGTPQPELFDGDRTLPVTSTRTGATTKDLMARMGHDDMRAALIYQRATSEADQLIADRMSALVDGRKVDEEDPDGHEDGPAGALVPAR